MSSRPSPPLSRVRLPLFAAASATIVLLAGCHDRATLTWADTPAAVREAALAFAGAPVREVRTVPGTDGYRVVVETPGRRVQLDIDREGGVHQVVEAVRYTPPLRGTTDRELQSLANQAVRVASAALHPTSPGQDVLIAELVRDVESASSRLPRAEQARLGALAAAVQSAADSRDGQAAASAALTLLHQAAEAGRDDPASPRAALLLLHDALRLQLLAGARPFDLAAAQVAVNDASRHFHALVPRVADRDLAANLRAAQQRLQPALDHGWPPHVAQAAAELRTATSLVRRALADPAPFATQGPAPQGAVVAALQR